MERKGHFKIYSFYHVFSNSLLLIAFTKYYDTDKEFYNKKLNVKFQILKEKKIHPYRVKFNHTMYQRDGAK